MNKALQRVALICIGAFVVWMPLTYLHIMSLIGSGLYFLLLILGSVIIGILLAVWQRK